MWSEISIDGFLIYHISSYNVADSVVSNTQPIGRMQKIIYDILISSRPIVVVVEHQRTSPTHLWTSKNIVYHIWQLIYHPAGTLYIIYHISYTSICELTSLAVSIVGRRRSYMIYLDFPGSPPADQNIRGSPPDVEDHIWYTRITRPRSVCEHLWTSPNLYDPSTRAWIS